MLTRIELTNFMSHQHTVIEPAAGVTVLIGPNNVGKSAVVAALQILCHNEKSTYVTRHGERECAVEVHTDDGHVIQWRRKNSPSYMIDGVKFDRLRGSGLPDELHQALRMAKVDGTDVDRFDIHFGEQKSPMFLLNDKPAAAARFFASSSDAIRLVAMQKQHRDKLTAARSTKKRLDEESTELNHELAALAPAVEIHKRVEAAQRDYEALQLAEKSLVDAADDIRSLRLWIETADRVAADVATLTPLARPPEMSPTESLDASIHTLSREQHQLEVTKSNCAAMGGLEAPPKLQDTSALALMANQLDRVSQGMRRCKDEDGLLSQLAVPPVLHQDDMLQKMLNQILSAKRELGLADGRATAVSQVSLPPELSSEGELRRFINSLKTLQAEESRWRCEFSIVSNVKVPPIPLRTTEPATDISTLQAAVELVAFSKAKLKSAEAELAAAAAELRVAAEGAACPICGADLDADQIVERAAAMEGHDHG